MNHDSVPYGGAAPSSSGSTVESGGSSSIMVRTECVSPLTGDGTLVFIPTASSPCSPRCLSPLLPPPSLPPQNAIRAMDAPHLSASQRRGILTPTRPQRDNVNTGRKQQRDAQNPAKSVNGKRSSDEHSPPSSPPATSSSVSRSVRRRAERRILIASSDDEDGASGICNRKSSISGSSSVSRNGTAQHAASSNSSRSSSTSRSGSRSERQQNRQQYAYREPSIERRSSGPPHTLC